MVVCVVVSSLFRSSLHAGGTDDINFIVFRFAALVFSAAPNVYVSVYTWEDTTKLRSHCTLVLSAHL